MRAPIRLIVGFFSVLALLPLSAQTSPAAPAGATQSTQSSAPPAQAPDEMTKKISDLVHAGKYSDAQKLTAAMLIVYPGDQRLIKAKALIDQLLAAAPAATTPTPPSPPVAAPEVPAANPETDTSAADFIVPPSGSSSPDAVDTANHGPAILHLYRPSHFAGSAGAIGIYLDGAKVASIHNGQAIRMLIQPGKHSISISAGGLRTRQPINDLDMEAGHAYWVRTTLGMWAPIVSVMPAAQAEAESQNLRGTEASDQPKK